jgi:hypothetical protein
MQLKGALPPRDGFWQAGREGASHQTALIWQTFKPFSWLSEDAQRILLASLAAQHFLEKWRQGGAKRK